MAEEKSEMAEIMRALGFNSIGEFAPEWRKLNDQDKLDLRTYYGLMAKSA